MNTTWSKIKNNPVSNLLGLTYNELEVSDRSKNLVDSILVLTPSETYPVNVKVLKQYDPSLKIDKQYSIGIQALNEYVNDIKICSLFALTGRMAKVYSLDIQIVKEV
jgi:hypothetical protein